MDICRRLRTASILLALGTFVCSCASRHSSNGLSLLSKPGTNSKLGQYQTMENFNSWRGQSGPNISENLDELLLLPPTEKKNYEVFEELKKELYEALKNRYADGAGRIALRAPSGEANVIEDLRVESFDSSKAVFSFSYKNVGDYNEDGKVSILDIYPLADYFFARVGEEPEAEVIDGNFNGYVEIMDVMAIADNFFVNCAGYILEGATDQAPDNWTEIEDAFVPISEMEDLPGRNRLSISASWQGYQNFRVVPRDKNGELGIPGLPIHFAPKAPKITSVEPTSGIRSSNVTFTVSATGTTPISYSWDFGGGAEPNTPQGRIVAVTLAGAGQHSAKVTASNAVGNDVFPFTLFVEPIAPQIISVSPQDGITGEEVTFVAEVSGDEPIDYFWNFGGGAIPNEASTDIAQVSVTLQSPQTYNCSVTALNTDFPSFQHTFNFQLTVYAEGTPPHIISVSPQSGEEGQIVTFSAVVTGDEPISYSWNFGGGAEPNISNEISPQVILLSPNIYNASLSCENASGSDTFNFQLRVFPLNAGFKVVVTNESAGHPSLQIVNGYPAIVFTKYGESGESACYVRALDELGSSWGNYQEYIVSNASYRNNLLRIVDGKPAGVTSVSFMIEGGRIDFASAQDPAGDIWNPVISLFSEFQIGPTAAGLFEVMGTPAVAFSNDDYSGNCKLLYKRANDPSGLDWPDTFVEVATISSSSRAETSLIIAGGRPAILHTFWTGSIYVRAGDEYGNIWGTPIGIGGMATHSDMKIIGGMPAIAMETGGELPHMLIFRRALDPDGNSWNTEVVVDSDVVGNLGRICLAEINGKPAIAYTDKGETFNYVANFAIAKDSQGVEWEVPIMVDPATNVSDGISLCEVMGKPALAYGNRDAKELIFIRANDPDGKDWPQT